MFFVGNLIKQSQCTALLLALLCYTEKLTFAAGKPVENSLLDLSIEELMKVEVTTVSRHSQKLTQVPSAVFVITQDDIRRSGATNIPDALRMAPGVQVDRVSADKWAISIRGFNGIYANKLQVLMDGRSVYSPIFSGVIWEQQDTLMEDIERIEIIRGPAAVSWGSNAVNGVINIITKKAADTQGTLLTAGGGTFEQGFVGARFGGKINEDTPFRIYAKGFARNNTQSLSRESVNDQWQSARSGFRVDHSRGIDQLTLQGDVFYLADGNTLNSNGLSLAPNLNSELRGHHEGGNIRFRWDRTYSERSSVMFQTYYDRNSVHLLPIGRSFAESFDADFQHRFPLFDRHNLIWGANYRLYHNHIFDTPMVKFSPITQTNHVIGTFIRDDVTLIPERLQFTIGSRFEHNDFTGWEIQPNARLMWTPNTENSIWLAVSRAVRTPSRAENDLAQYNSGGLQNTSGFPAFPFPIVSTLQGNSNFNSEKLIAYELGYRRQISTQASIDLTGFINDYSQLRDLSFGVFTLTPGLPRQLIVPVSFSNQASALTYGFESSIDWRPRENWRLQSSYSFLNMHIHSNELLKGSDPTTGGADKISARHLLSLRSNYDISERLQFNLWLRYISNISFYHIPGFVTMDAKLIFKPTKNTELFLVGQNLFSQHHQEMVADTFPTIPTMIPRGMYAGAQWRF
ncbi:TonB-dependent receptor [Nitrosomonas sp. JL21]|uniref:TonB-dependent receptor plug domain-containing protein n=1 Tax=Nitrosomonas sp. JL21 TaxID=153949 RepID=UPI00136D8813|nr:TonB-dependent receptor [Nitrosomonas sp. JL21]MBL8498622.1 TonB-dependent receptor [Nitrosomonas sp.]MCC7091632.1 TonB-dependent receptor [Nitrosomonas sp.]MXS77293.1 TonB-dependent receptor [Nitrosomonas sp. JL21]